MSGGVIALIPARSGSKSVPHKNIRPLAGMPLLAWSIRHALECPEVNRVIVSTDSEAYAELAIKYGAEVPFLRPAEFARDLSTDLEVFQHALLWLNEHERHVPDIVVHLRPTCPYRRVRDISAMIRMLSERPDADSVRSLVVASETPYKMWSKGPNDLLRPVASCDIKEAYNSPRQILPCAYVHNGAVDVIRTSTILSGHSMTGGAILGYVMQDMVDIDTEEQFAAAELILALESGAEIEKRNFCIGVEGVLVSPRDYTAPNLQAIEAVNRLYTLGHQVALRTILNREADPAAFEALRMRLEQWGVCFHSLRDKRPVADFYIEEPQFSLKSLLNSSAALK